MSNSSILKIQLSQVTKNNQQLQRHEAYHWGVTDIQSFQSSQSRADGLQGWALQGGMTKVKLPQVGQLPQDF